MNLRRGKQLPAAVWYICRGIEELTADVFSQSSRHVMPRHASRADGAVGTAPDTARIRSCAAPSAISLDARPASISPTRLRVFQRALRSRVERRDALLEIVRAVNATLEPAEDRRARSSSARRLGAGAVLGGRLRRSVRAAVRARRPRPDARHGARGLRDRRAG